MILSFSIPAFATAGTYGPGLIDPSTIYYTNPLGDTTAPGATLGQVSDAECGYQVTDTSTVVLVLKVTMGAFTGGGANMTNGAGTPTASAYGAWAWKSGDTYSTGKVVIPTSGATALYTGTTAGDAGIKWGATISTQTGDWTSGASSTATMTITATKKP